MLLMSGESVGKQALTRKEGIGPRAQVEDFMPGSMEERSVSLKRPGWRRKRRT